MPNLVVCESKAQFEVAAASLQDLSSVEYLTRDTLSTWKATQKFSHCTMWLAQATDSDFQIIHQSLSSSSSISARFASTTSDTSSPIFSQSNLCARMTLAGFVGAKIVKTLGLDEAGSTWDDVFAGLGTDPRTVQFVEVEATTPAWQTGSSAQIRRKAPQSTASSTQPASTPANGKSVWSISADALGSDNYINENDLLDGVDLKKPQTQPTRAPCPPTKKACKNCSCGRAQLDQENTGSVVMITDLAVDAGTGLQPLKSACGNCSLGDAFRCASCPFAGLPPFKKGDEGKVLLDVNGLAEDI
jgi:hypothetical protein